MGALAQSSVLYAEEGLQDKRLKVVIADDHPLLLAGIRRSLDGHPDIEIIGEARSGPELIGIVERRKPDVVVLDLRMPGVVGASCIEQLSTRWPEIKSVVLSAETDQATVNEALSAGAAAYVVKSVNSSDLGSVIRQSANGSAIFHASGRPAARAAEPIEPAGPQLTARERSILSAVACGKTTAAISRELWVSEHTVKFHLTNIYRKLGVKNRTGAVRYALEAGLCDE
jgi:DNA-binding NarL/FixJ family response regulator